MKVYNQDKTKILEDYDLTYGELKSDTLIIHHKEVKGQEEKGHYEVIAEYPNGGKDVKWVVDVPYIEHQDAYDEEEQIQVYVPYSKKRIAEIDEEKNLALLMNELASTDYEALKYAEGWFTDEEYAPIKKHREELREQIRAIIDKSNNENNTK